MPSATHTVYYMGIVISVMIYSAHTSIIWYGHQWHDRRHQSPHLAPPSSTTVIIMVILPPLLKWSIIWYRHWWLDRRHHCPPHLAPSSSTTGYHNESIVGHHVTSLYLIVNSVSGIQSNHTRCHAMPHNSAPLCPFLSIPYNNTAATTQIAVGPYFQVLFSSEAPDPSSIK
ncbi:hypothetical protein INT47_005716 [Mucor saturninus]|uniref:Uncharacterized protein n=1 Tax=Mucor saturninus TaxID=64648 RepID=A0A8H7QEU3_9FUNG|nr:hypothetical protein INT47_005716 [Mucor saturninus]